MLPKEVSVAERFGVSRGTAREALRALEERRVAVVRHGLGATVQDATEWDVLDPLVAAPLLGRRGRRRLLEELLESLRILEPALAALAAERATGADREAIAGAARAVAAGERGAGLALSRRVGVAARNRPLAVTAASAWELLAMAVDEAVADDGPAAQRLAEALAGRDADAAREAARTRLDGVRTTRQRRRSGA